eukprot:163870-Hanusia_phi.AAC.2
MTRTVRVSIERQRYSTLTQQMLPARQSQYALAHAGWAIHDSQAAIAPAALSRSPPGLSGTSWVARRDVLDH